MWNKKVIILSVVLFVAISGLLYTTFATVPAKTKETVDLEKEIQFLKNSIEFLKEDVNVLLKNELWRIESEQIRINPELVLYTSLIDSTKIKDIIGDGKMFFYFGEYSCQQCYQEVIDKLNRYIEISNSTSIAVIAHFENFRQFHFFAKNVQLKAPMYYTAKKLGLSVENSLQPFLFVLDNSFKATCVFIPNKKYNENVEQYFRLVQK